MNLYETFECLCFLFLMQRYNKNGALAKTFSERPDSYSKRLFLLFYLFTFYLFLYRFGLISFHFEMAGTMPSVTSSSRILHRCS